MEFSIGAPDAPDWKSVYKIMIGSIVPRPIGWIATINEQGQPNLAPYSFFNAVCPNPPHVLFCTNIRSTDGSTKDTYKNVLATREFVVNIVTEDLAEAMNFTATEFPANINEIEAAGLTTAPSWTVQPPRVAESPIHYECELAQVMVISDQPGGGAVVVGRVRHIHVADHVLLGNDKVDLAALKPIGRLAGTSYTRVTDLFDLVRPPSQIKKLD